MAVDPAEPFSREEQYLAAIAGEGVEVPPCPWNRKEAYLDKINQEIEDLKNNPDVVDIVDTYADLQAYDKTKLTDKDIIRVLNDETHDDESTYYRYSAETGEFTYIGTTKQYTNFIGTDGTTAGEAGLVPAPAIADAGKFLKADGTWDNAGSSVNVVQTIGNSTTDVMSQNATMKIIFPLNETTNVRSNHIQIGANRLPSSSTQLAIAIGKCAQATSDYTTAIGAWGTLNGNQTQAIGYGATAVGSMSKAMEMGATALGGGTASGKGSVALGNSSSASAQGEMNIGSANTSYGYNSTNYRLLSGVYDGQSAHDAATYGQLDTRLGGLTVVSLTQAAYDALATKDPNTLYVIKAS